MGSKLSALRSGCDVGGDVEKVSGIDKLCPELLACILKEAAQGNPQRLRELATVNKMFQEATCQCVITLVLRQQVLSEKLSERAHCSPCAALFREINLRPAVSKLVIDWEGEEAIPGSLWPALYKVRWTSLEVILSKKRGIINFVRLLPASKLSLRTLELGARLYSYLDRDIEHIVHAFPKLETLTLRELCKNNTPLGGGLEAFGVTNSLTSLHLAMPVPGLADAASLLPNCLQALRSLRFQCPFLSHQIRIRADSPLRRLQSLRIDIRNQTLCDILLQEVAQICPCLQHLVLHARPDSTLQPTLPLSDVFVLKLLDGCPDLTDIVISRGEVVPRLQFSDKIFRAYSHIASENKQNAIIVELDDDSCRDGELGTRVRILRCVVPIGTPTSIWDGPETPQWIIGEEWVVRDWCNTFFNTEVGGGALVQEDAR